MANRPDLDDDDDDFSEIYKAYTGPGGTSAAKAQEKETPSKTAPPDVDEEKEVDLYSVPTDFTSRDAKVWEAKSKATERNWQKRKEEEMICKICGDSSHYTQGCPSTLGASRKSQDFFQRVPARDRRVRALLTGKVIERIEKDTGCKIRMDEKFLFVHAKDGMILAKGVDAVHKIIQEEGANDGSPGFHKGRSRSPERRIRSRSPERRVRSRSPDRRVRSRSPERRVKSRSPERRVRSRSPERRVISRSPERRVISRSPERRVRSRSPERRVRSRSPERSSSASKFARSESEISHRSPRNASQSHQRVGRQESNVGGRFRDELHRPSRNSPQAYGSDGGRDHPSRSKSPARHSYDGKSYNSHDVGRHGMGSYMPSGWKNERRVSEMLADPKYDQSSVPQTLEELEKEYERDAMVLARIRDQQEDDESRNHREAMRELRENYLKKLSMLRGTHSKRWEDFLQSDAHRQQHQLALRQRVSSTYDDYNHPGYNDYDGSSLTSHGYGQPFPMDSRCRHPDPAENYPTPSARDTYNDFQGQRSGDYGRAYNRY